jgi:hypothetical protein
MKQLVNLLFITSIILFAGCSHQPIVIESTKSQVELRAMQSKEVDSTDTLRITKAVLQLLQDDNFEINNLDSNVGYLKASKKLDGGKEKYEFAWYDIYYPIAIYKYLTLGEYVKEISTTISIRNFEKISVVRASFIMEVKNEDNELVSRAVIEDPKFYQTFFGKLDKALFLEQNKI